MMISPMAQTTGQRLDALRQRAELSLDRLAQRAGYKGASSIQRYFEPSYEGPTGIKAAERLAQALAGLGDPPIGAGDVLRAALHKAPLESPEHPATIPAGDVSTGAIVVDELDVRASGGYGLVHEVSNAEPVTNRWQMPRDILKAQTSAPASSLKIITVYGDSMAPDFLPGERVLVDTSDKRPSPPGVFVLWDGLALVIKRLEVLPGAQALSIIPSNPHYATYEQPLADVQINGRVIGKWQWT